MRISALMGDPDFLGGEISRAARVYLDGVVQHDVVEASEEAGTVAVLARDAKGHFHPSLENPRVAATEIRTGRVEILFQSARPMPDYLVDVLKARGKTVVEVRQ